MFIKKYREFVRTLKTIFCNWNWNYIQLFEKVIANEIIENCFFKLNAQRLIIVKVNCLAFTFVRYR